MNKLIMLCALSFFLIGCGGGGGSGSAVGGDRYGVRVLHGGLELSPVEFSSPGEGEKLFASHFLSSSLYHAFLEGSQTVSLFRANSGGSRLVKSMTFLVAPETRYTVFLYGDETELGPRMAVFTDAIPSLSESVSAVRFLDGVDGASAITVMNTDISFGGSSGYATVPSGEFSYVAFRKSDKRQIVSGTLLLEEDSAYTILLGGEVDVFVGTEFVKDS